MTRPRGIDPAGPDGSGPSTSMHNGHGRDARPWPSMSFALNAGYRPLLLPAEVSGLVPVEPVPVEVVEEVLFFSLVVVLVVSPEPEPP